MGLFWTTLGPLSFPQFQQPKTRFMYAIIADGAHQYKVESGQILEIDFRDLSPGDEITFDRVLAVSSDAGFKLGQPNLAGATVTAKVIGDTLGEKLTVQKFRRRKNSKRRTGHRQKYVKVQIGTIA
jgi:large subunit ribosomal protein L21